MKGDATVVLSQLERWGSSGWQWLAVRGASATTCELRMWLRTNSEGQGLFARLEHEGAWSQSQGTLQFSLADAGDVRLAVVAYYCDLQQTARWEE